jgi:flavin-binding protein dodecin
LLIAGGGAILSFTKVNESDLFGAKKNMQDPVYKLIELTGTSTASIEDAVANAIKRAHKTVKNLSWFQVVETRGNIIKGKVHHWQVTLKIGFAVKD